MKILILTFYYQPDLCAGSFRATAFARELCRALGEDSHIEIVTTLPNRYQSYANEAPMVEICGNATINRIKLPIHNSGMLDQSLAFAKFAFETQRYSKGKDYDIVFATSSRLFTAFLGALIARKKKTKLYLDVRDIFTDTLKDVLKNRFTKLLMPVLLQVEKYTIKSACRVNLVSEGFTEYFKTLAPEQTYSFFPNGIDDEFIGYDFTKLNNTSRKIILYAGNIGEGQGLEKIIPGCAKALEDSCEFWVIGDGGTKAKLETALQQGGVNNVRLVKPVGRADLLELYAQSDFLFMHLNNYKAFEKVLPSKIFEYAATGKPILAGVGGFARSFIEKQITGALVFEPCNINDFLLKFNAMADGTVLRPEFIEKFTRKNIMSKMAREFVACIRKHD